MLLVFFFFIFRFVTGLKFFCIVQVLYLVNVASSNRNVCVVWATQELHLFVLPNRLSHLPPAFSSERKATMKQPLTLLLISRHGPCWIHSYDVDDM